MKVIYVGAVPWVSNAPSVTFVTYNAMGIAQNEVETHLLVMNRSHDETDMLLRQVFDTERPPHLSIHRLTASSHWHFARRVVPLIASLLDSETTVVTRAISLLPHLLWLRRTHRFLLLYESHNFYWDLRHRDDVDTRRKLKRSLNERLWIPRTDGLICLQNTQQNLYRRVLPRDFPIAVLRTGIHRLFPPHIEARKNVLAYVGSLDAHKGIDQLLRLAEILEQKYTIEILGGRTETEVATWRKRISKKGLEEKIFVSGWLTKAELHARLAAVQWGLLPLHNTFFNAYVTSPLKLFDFYAHGIPVLAADVPSLREMVEHEKTGFLVNWEDPQHICPMLEIAQPAYAAMVGQVLERASDLLWQKRGTRLLEFIHSLQKM